MNDLKRKDKVFIVVFALAALVMSVANPSDYDIRSLAWDVALLIVAACSFFWFIGELGNVAASGIVGDNGSMAVIPRSRKELVDMVGDVTGMSEKKLNGMSDVELTGILTNHAKASKAVSRAEHGEVAPLGIIFVSSLRMLFKVISNVIKVVIHMPRTIRNIPKVIRAGIKKAKKLWKEESR